MVEPQQDEQANKGPLFPSASPQRPWLHHWMWGARGHRRKRRGYSQRHPHFRPLHSQEGALGWGPRVPGSGPAGTWICRGRRATLPISWPQFPPLRYPWHPSSTRCPLLISALSPAPNSPPHPLLPIPSNSQPAPLAQDQALTLNTFQPPSGQEEVFGAWGWCLPARNGLEGSKLSLPARRWTGQGPAICKQGVLHVSVSLGGPCLCKTTGQSEESSGPRGPGVQVLSLAASLPAFCRPACSSLAVFCHSPPPTFLPGSPHRPSTFPVSSPAPFPEWPIFLG